MKFYFVAKSFQDFVQKIVFMYIAGRIKLSILVMVPITFYIVLFAQHVFSCSAVISPISHSSVNFFFYLCK